MQPRQITAVDFEELNNSSTHVRSNDQGKMLTTTGEHDTVGTWSVIQIVGAPFFGWIVSSADPEDLGKHLRARTAVPYAGDEFGNDARSIA
jgi:hypothetical protein